MAVCIRVAVIRESNGYITTVDGEKRSCRCECDLEVTDMIVNVIAKDLFTLSESTSVYVRRRA